MALDPAMPILIVDDYRMMVRIMRGLLKQFGFEDVDDAPSGVDAIQSLRRRKYGLVISNWGMEPMTGYDLLRHVRGEAALRDTPFILVTAELRAENMTAAQKAGANDCIVKPFSAQTLKATIETACGA
ncbi:MAG: two-component system response regulator [Rhizobiales bacterium 65-9]|nr:response regulator [Hyphomicrobiales bacterium]OJY38100.1 MAG: two-component system response regulator [Rhizobiales bacterium 65-9]